MQKTDNSESSDITLVSKDNDIGSTIIGLKNITAVGNFGGNSGVNLGGNQVCPNLILLFLNVLSLCLNAHQFLIFNIKYFLIDIINYK